MQISDIARSIGESATLKLNATAAALKSRGEPVIHLGGGEPVSKAPASAIAAASELLKTGEIRYAPAGGIPAMKGAIISYTHEHYRREPSREQVMASGGAKQAIMVALQAVAGAGDEVLFPIPYWVSYPDMARLCGAAPVPVQPSGPHYRPCLQDIEAAVTPRTRAIIINSPNNPSGVVYEKAFLADVIGLCRQRDICLIMDDIYQRLVFTDAGPVSCYEIAGCDVEDVPMVVVNGVSKQYAMTGFRLGWAVGPAELIKVMSRIQGHQTSGSSVLAQRAAIGALEGPQDCVTQLRDDLLENRAVLMECLQGIEGVQAIPPDGTFYCLVDFSRYDSNSVRLAQYLLEEAKVVTIPGAAFGLDGHLRISFCGAASAMREGIERIAAALPAYAPEKTANC